MLKQKRGLFFRNRRRYVHMRMGSARFRQGFGVLKNSQSAKVQSFWCSLCFTSTSSLELLKPQHPTISLRTTKLTVRGRFKLYENHSSPAVWQERKLGIGRGRSQRYSMLANETNETSNISTSLAQTNSGSGREPRRASTGIPIGSL